MSELAKIAAALGGEIAGHNSIVAPGPGHSPRDRSLSVRIAPDAPDGFIVHSFANDDPLLCRDYVRQRLGLPAWQPGDGQRRAWKTRQYNIAQIRQASDDAESFGPREWTEEELGRIEAARRIWNEGKDLRGTLAEQYLVEHRKLLVPDEFAGAVLRFHPQCPWRNENTGGTDYLPALIAAFRSIDDNSITGIHRIALRSDATKIARRMLGIVQRAAIKLDPISNRLAIGEGIETCLAGRECGATPAWALGSAGAISFFPVLAGVKDLAIFAECDETNARAIEICGRRWLRSSRRVTVIRPKFGDDINSALIEERRGRENEKA